MAGFFSNCGKQGLLSSCRALASHFSGFSCYEARVLGAWASWCSVRSSVLAAPELQARALVVALAQLLCGMWDLPKTRDKPVSPALSGFCLPLI